jgi:hypothetical protein
MPLASTDESDSLHHIKRKPPPPIDVEILTKSVRYPSPDPADPLASLAQLRARKRASHTYESLFEDGVVHIVHHDDEVLSPSMSLWYEVYPNAPISLGYMPSHLQRDSLSPKPVSRTRSLNSGKQQSHYRPHSLTVTRPNTRDSLSPPSLTSDSDDTSSWEDSSLSSAPNGTDLHHHGVLSTDVPVLISHHNISSTSRDLPKSEKRKRRNLKRSSVASSIFSYSCHSSVPVALENHSPRSTAENRPHPFASSLHTQRRYSSDNLQDFTAKNRVELFVHLRDDKAPSVSEFVPSLRSSYLQVNTAPTHKPNTRLLTPISELSPTMRIPTVFDLTYAANHEVTAENGMHVRFGELCTSSKTIVCFIRHFWCRHSQDYIASLCRELDIETLRREGARLVVISPGSPRVIKSYRSMFHAGLEVYCDTTHRLYETLGMRRVEQKHFRGAKYALVRNLLRIIRFSQGKAQNQDQLGGEFVFRGSSLRCCFAHRMIAIGDHTPVSDILKFAGLGTQPPDISKMRMPKFKPTSFLQLSEPRRVTI